MVSSATPVPEPPADTLDLLEAADKIRPSNDALAELLVAVQDVAEDDTHMVVDYPEGGPECADDCSPCAAQYAARIVADEFLAAQTGGAR